MTRWLIFFALCWVPLTAQQTTAPAPVPTAAPAAVLSPTNIKWLPQHVYTAGGGFASPNGKFAYLSESTFIGAGTYATVAIEDTIVAGKVSSCTLAGVTKPLYQFGFLTVGLTGLGGGCTGGGTGNSMPAGEGQAFLDCRWGKLPIGNTITAMKLTTGGFKVTIGFRWAQ